MSITIKNRREAYNEIKPKRKTRKEMILKILTDGNHSGMTAEDIAQQLLQNGAITYIDSNFVRPRLTELKDDGKVEVVGKRRSSITARNVSVWKVVKH